LKKTLRELKEKNRVLQNAAGEKIVSKEILNSLQRQHEIIVKENAELKASLFEVETQSKSSNSDKKLKVISKIQEILAEVIYSYKTMNVNAREFADSFILKNEYAKEFISLIDELEKCKKGTE